MARPNRAVEVNHKTGRDVGLAESGFALPDVFRPSRRVSTWPDLTRPFSSKTR